jgi:hypothetical protein
VLRINQRLDDLFDQQLSDMVSMTNEKKGDIYKSIETFAKFYDISEDDRSIPTLIKMYYRARYTGNPIERERKIKEEIHKWKQLSIFDK